MNLSDFAKQLGQKGGQSRAQKLSAERKKQIAALGGKSRARSFALARLIEINFRYLDAIRALRQETITVKKEKNCPHPLPGLYAHQKK